MDFIDHFMPGQAAAPRRLAVVLHGFGSGAANRQSMVRAVADIFPAAAIYASELPYRSQLCDMRMVDVVAHVAKTIDDIVAAHGIDEIVLIGHSTGALVARKLVLVAWGAADDVTVAGRAAGTRLPWAENIRRLVFLAGINRGWTFSSSINPLEGLFWSAGIGFLQLRGWLKGLVSERRQATILQVRRGAPFLATTRLQWLGLMADEKCRPAAALIIVQTIGTIDEFVSPEDAVDHVLDSRTIPMDRARGEDRVWARFFMLEMPSTGHMDASSFFPTMGCDPHVHAVRREVLRDALTLDPDRLTKNPRFIRRRHMEDDLPPLPDSTIKDVVFVVHGIRDKGFWTKKIARKVKELAHAEPLRLENFSDQERAVLETRRKRVTEPTRDLLVRSVTASYGYFAMAPFILPWIRTEKVEWLIDLYVETRSRYPEAIFHYVGHSNGTYLLAAALQRCPLIAFKHVVFAGSVVRRDYDWLSVLAPDAARGLPIRVQKVMNYVATGDWVVAIFPNALQSMRGFDLGSAGHDGFATEKGNPAMLDIRYVSGSHSAGIRESQWDEIAAFVLKGDFPVVPRGERPPDKIDDDKLLARNDDYVPRQSRFICWLGRLSVPLLVLAAIGIGWLPVHLYNSGTLTSSHAAAWGAFLVFYALFVKAVLTRV